MRPFLFIILLQIFAFQSPLSASPGRGDSSLLVLKKEVEMLFQKNAVQFPDLADQAVTVGFLINARHELILLDVTSDSASAGEYVKQVLNYNKVHFSQAKQLTRYSITIHLVGQKDKFS